MISCLNKLLGIPLKKTGNINTFIEFKQLRDLEKKIEEEKNGNNKDKRNYIS